MKWLKAAKWRVVGDLQNTGAICLSFEESVLFQSCCLERTAHRRVLGVGRPFLSWVSSVDLPRLETVSGISTRVETSCVCVLFCVGFVELDRKVLGCYCTRLRDCMRGGDYKGFFDVVDYDLLRGVVVVCFLLVSLGGFFVC